MWLKFKFPYLQMSETANQLNLNFSSCHNIMDSSQKDLCSGFLQFQNNFGLGVKTNKNRVKNICIKIINFHGRVFIEHRKPKQQALVFTRKKHQQYPIIDIDPEQRFVSSTGNIEVLLSHTHSIVCEQPILTQIKILSNFFPIFSHL